MGFARTEIIYPILACEHAVEEFTDETTIDEIKHTIIKLDAEHRDRVRAIYTKHWAVFARVMAPPYV